MDQSSEGLEFIDTSDVTVLDTFKAASGEMMIVCQEHGMEVTPLKFLILESERYGKQVFAFDVTDWVRLIELMESQSRVDK